MSKCTLCKWTGGALVLAAVGLAFWVRLTGLGTSASRTDEINFWKEAMGLPDQSTWQQLCAMWREPTWWNQMPTADSIPVAWCSLLGQRGPDVTIAQVRLPFALLGGASVAALAAWLWFRGRRGAAGLAAVWLALLPLHLYHSREAYYYAPELFMAALALPWVAGAMADVLSGRRRQPTSGWLALGVALMVGLCLTHMSAWAPAAVAWLALGVTLWVTTSPARRRPERKRALGLWTAAGIIIALAMSRWIARGIHEIMRSQTGETDFVGASASWVLPRVLPFFCGGANGVGIGVLLTVLAAAVAAGFLLRRSQLPPPSSAHASPIPAPDAPAPAPDYLYRSTSWLLLAVLVANFAYVGFFGGGLGKMSYFSACLPLFVAWCAMGLERLCHAVFPRSGTAMSLSLVALGLALLAAFAGMARDVVRLPGRPTPYVALRDWLDANLPSGTTAIVDRWYEPWNEMALYAPTNVHVTFTIPDEPYENYVHGRWRDVTRQTFESGDAQAFIRLTRNHEKRMGLWQWPEKFFAHHAVVTNDIGLRMVATGSAPMEDFYDFPSRLQIEVFYDLPDEVAAKQVVKGARGWASFGPGWTLFKPWQQGIWHDYHLLRNGETATLELRNPSDQPISATLEVRAQSLGGTAVCSAGRLGRFSFEPGMLAIQALDVVLQPGLTEVPFRMHSTDSPGLAIESIRLR
ncbi:MAG: hypothetical protein ILO10_01320 [Kiritimatiellae bacterium]|nr:hypothetical protein [Kiritimatiellia bacterium]